MSHDVDSRNQAVTEGFPEFPESRILNDDESAVEACHIKGLAGGHECDGLGGHFRTEGCDGNVAVAGIKEIAVDLVRAEDQMVAKTDFGNPFQFLSRVDSTHGIVGIAEEKDLGLMGNRRFKGVKIDLIGVFPLNEGRIMNNPAVDHRIMDEMEIDRGLNQYLISRMGESMVGHIEAGDQAGQENDLLLLNLPPVEPLEPFLDRSPQLLGRAGVPEDPVIDPLMKSLNDWFGRDKIHVGNPQGKDVVPISLPFVTVRALSLDDLIKIVFHLFASARKPVYFHWLRSSTLPLMSING
jgi:hypothetical protein